MTVTSEDIDYYQKNGAVIIRGLFSPGEIKLLEEGIAANMAAPSDLAIVASHPEDPGYFMKIFAIGSVSLPTSV